MKVLAYQSVTTSSSQDIFESFWVYVKERLAKYHGIKPEELYLHLKELEFRFNNRLNKDLETKILTYLLDFMSLSG